MKIVRYLASGVMGITVNLGSLFILVHVFDVHYLAASITAVSISTIVGFLLQKFWTFGERSFSRSRSQFLLYTLVAILNILLNTFIVYVLTGVLGLHYLIGQFVGAAVVAVWSYFIYRHVIFSVLTQGGGAPTTL